MSYAQLERIIKIHSLIRDEHYPNADSLVEQLGVQRRQIFEDRRFLIDLGATIKFSRKRGGWYYAHPWELPFTLVTQGDILAFILSIDVVRRYKGTALEVPLQVAIKGFAENLKETALINLTTLNEYYSFTHPPSMYANTNTLMDLYLALQRRNTVRLRYYCIEDDAEVVRKVDPHHLHSFQENWFLIAFCQTTQTMQTFHVGRIKTLSMLDETFHRQPDFDASTWIASTFQGEHGPATYEVRIRFDAYQARFVREQADKYPDQRVEELPDGGLILTLYTSGLGRLKRWVLSFGHRAEVLAPAFLRDEVAEELARTQELYETAYTTFG